MAPKAKTNKTTKGMKENIRVDDRSKITSVNKVAISSRKALADKTNSASDDNESLVVPKKFTKEVFPINEKQAVTEERKGRPHRNRRVPTRYMGNHILKTLSNCTEGGPVTTISDKGNAKKICSNPKPVSKTEKDLENSLITNRPRRICRLPSKFDGNFISPKKHVHVQPCHTSTPITINNKDSRIKQRNAHIEVSPQTHIPESAAVNTSGHDKVSQQLSVQKEPIKKLNSLKNINDSPKDKTNTVSISHIRRGTNLHAENTHHNTSKSQKNVIGRKYRDKEKNKRILNNSNSFKLLEDKNSKGADVYEFTYDPNEEPPPQKKKRKRVNKRKPAQPKVVVWKNNYDKNMSKVLAGLKVIVSQKSQQPEGKDDIKKVQLNIDNNRNHVNKIAENQLATQNIVQTATDKSFQQNDTQAVNNKLIINNPSNLIDTSIQIDDIVADFNALVDYQDDINYSPVNSPIHPKTPTAQHNVQNNRDLSPVRSSTLNNDPLNLRDELNLDFFDEPPVASSSVNVSTRSAKHPLASPWRAEFDNLPIKWHVNTYMKSNMTPAVESSYINFDDSNRKKHVYTNLVAQTNENLPEIIESRLKQMSIISYIKEVVEKSATKKKQVRSVTPVHHNSIFDDITNDSVSTSINAVDKTPRKLVTPRKDNPISSTTPNKSTSKENISNSSKNSSKDSKSSKELRKRKNDSDSCDIPKKTPRKGKNDVDTFFGFDESENLEQENAPVNKNIDRNRVWSLRPRSRAVLKEINQQTGPTRGILPVGAETKLILGSEAVNQANNEMISAPDAPMFLEKDNAENNLKTTNICAQGTEDVINEDSQSVHLFEDIEPIHHFKTNRKSYAKPKKIAFRNNTSDSDVQDRDNVRAEMSESEDDFNALTFQMPEVRTKKRTKKKKTVTKKQLLSKKEAEEAEAWAAGFNSMCEDVDQFPLVIE